MIGWCAIMALLHQLFHLEPHPDISCYFLLAMNSAFYREMKEQMTWKYLRWELQQLSDKCQQLVLLWKTPCFNSKMDTRLELRHEILLSLISWEKYSNILKRRMIHNKARDHLKVVLMNANLTFTVRTESWFCSLLYLEIIINSHWLHK